MFHYDDGLRLNRANLAVDFRRRQPVGFISHAHMDHLARHELALCTPATGALYQYRVGTRPVKEMPYRETLDWGGLRLTTYPAGHCLGSAMLLAEDDQQRLLYTGDFKLDESATAERAELPRADILVIESTYGQPAYRLPPRDESIERLCELVGAILRRSCTPVVEAYALGKAQELTRILTDHGFYVLQHAKAYGISQIYEQFGVSLGEFGRMGDRLDAPAVLILPPRARLNDTVKQPERIAVTGWAIEERTRYRLRTDHAIALSDHADYDALLETVARVDPKTVYCTHGPESFVHRLCEEGFDARPLGRAVQGRLF